MKDVSDTELLDLYRHGFLSAKKARELVLMRLSVRVTDNYLAFQAFHMGILSKADMVSYFEIEDADVQT